MSLETEYRSVRRNFNELLGAPKPQDYGVVTYTRWLVSVALVPRMTLRVLEEGWLI